MKYLLLGREEVNTILCNITKNTLGNDATCKNIFFLNN